MTILKVTVTAMLLLALGGAMAAVDLDDIKLPPGFSIEVYANVKDARSLALGDDGVVYVSNRRGKSVYAIRPGTQRNDVIEIAGNLKTPNGIAYHDGDLYVAEVKRVLVFRDISGRLANPPPPEELDVELPSKKHHGWRYIGFGPDGKLYISIGAPCNICERDGFARIIRVDIDTGQREIVARGVRNSVGFTWNNETGDFWFTDNGRDMLGDDSPPGELNRLTALGQHFGFPYCHGGEVLDPQYGKGKNCADYEAPVQKLDAHVAGLGVKFYTGDAFPEDYRGQIFIAEHGSWNRSKKSGYRITLVRLNGNTAVSYETFASGWLDGQSTRGRPVDLLVMPDGALLVSDDYDDKVYRITYTGATE